MNTLILYLSRKGKTKYFAHNIAKYIEGKGFNTTVKSVLDAKADLIDNYDCVFLGAWTHGLFFMFQHPNKEWQSFAKTLKTINTKKVALFTTYKIATGSMFNQMTKHLNLKKDDIELTLKSKKEELSEEHKNLIDRFYA